MSNIIYLTLNGELQGNISADCGTSASVGHRYQIGHEDQIFVFSLVQATARTSYAAQQQGLRFCKMLDKSSPLLTNAINNNECLTMVFDIYRINRYGRMERYYVIEIRGARLNGVYFELRPNNIGYEYISLSYDYIRCQHLLAGTEFYHLVTPDNYHQLFPVTQSVPVPQEPPVRKVTLVLGIFFDGTGNNAVNTRNMLIACAAQDFDIRSPDAESILARNASERMGVSGTEATSYTGYYTNIHWLNELYLKTFLDDSSYVQRAVYVEGVGTRAGEPDSMIGMGFGMADTGVTAKTDDAVAQLSSAVVAALKLLKGSYVVDALLFDIFGFSRGAAAARHFANRVQSEDRAIIKAVANGMKGYEYLGTAAGTTRFLGIFDTVAAIGLDPHSADTGDVDIRLRPGVAQHVFHITAQHECRHNFALNSVAPTGRS